MALPKISHPVFELTLPTTKQVIKFRPFLVKEEKLLLIAMQGEDPGEIVNSIKQVVNNCIVTENIDIENMATVDLEYLFIKIRSKSVNNIIKLTYRDLEDERKYDVEVNLDEVEVKFDESHTNKIEINETLGFFMKYPEANIDSKLKDSKTEADVLFDVLKNCIEKIYEGKEEYSVADSTEEELEEFIQSLDVKTFNKIQTFFATMPKLYHEVKYVNSKGNERTIALSSLSDFFTLG